MFRNGLLIGRTQAYSLLKTKTTENLTGKIELAEQEATLEEEQRELEAAKQLEERKEKEENILQRKRKLIKKN